MAGDDIDLPDSEFDETDAQLVLEVARARRGVSRLVQELAEARCAESIALVNLYKRRATDAKKQNDYAEYDLGFARDMVTRKHKPPPVVSVVRRPFAKRARLSSPSDRHSGSKCFKVLVHILSGR